MVVKGGQARLNSRGGCIEGSICSRLSVERQRVSSAGGIRDGDGLDVVEHRAAGTSQNSTTGDRQTFLIDQRASSCHRKAAGIAQGGGIAEVEAVLDCQGAAGCNAREPGESVAAPAQDAGCRTR